MKRGGEEHFNRRGTMNRKQWHWHYDVWGAGGVKRRNGKIPRNTQTNTDQGEIENLNGLLISK